MNQERSVRVVVGIRKHVYIPVAVKQPLGDADLVLVDRLGCVGPLLHWDVCDRPMMHTTMQSRLGMDCQSIAPTFFQGMPNLSSIHLSNVGRFNVATLALGQQ